MNQIGEYFQPAVSGWQRLVGEYRLMAPIIGILIYAVIGRQKHKNVQEKDFISYAAVMMFFLLIPVMAVGFLVYQTRFYDYEWVWSLVPLTGIFAWGIVTIAYKESVKTVWCILGAVLLLFLWGNQGELRRLPQEEAKLQYAAAEILQYVEEKDPGEELVLWGQQEILQYARSHNGCVQLFYGRDMWDAKAGAYDYETYSEEEINCYEWMEFITDSQNLDLLETDQPTEELSEALEEQNCLLSAIKAGVNCIILPSQLDSQMAQQMESAAKNMGLSVSAEQVDEYTLWMLTQ